MKRSGKIMLGLGAVLAAFGAGAVWLISSAVHVVDDVVDSGLSAAGKVEAAAHREAASVGRQASSQITGAVATTRKTFDGSEKPTSETTDETSTSQASVANEATLDAQTTKKASEGDVVSIAGKENAAPAKQTSAAKLDRETSDWEDLMDMGKTLLPMLSDSDDASPIDLKAVLNPSDKADTEKNGDSDEITDLIPGAKSPTVKKWLAGKYKGKEAQALEDALDDPQALRAVFFFVGM